VPSGDSAWPSTYSPLSSSLAAKSFMYVTCASISSGDHASIGMSTTSAGAALRR